MKLKAVQPATSADGIQIQGCGKFHETAEAAPSSRNCRAAIAKCRAGALAVELLEHVVRHGLRQAVAQLPRGLRPVVLAVPAGGYSSGRVGWG